MSLTFRTATGEQFADWIEPVAQLRIRVFREFPYLYAGDAAYERHYLQRYQQSAGSVLVLACAGDEVVGASTGLPMMDADSAFQQAFVDAGMDLSTISYFGESVLLSDYRGLGVGHHFFDERERVARQQGYGITSFCAVVRPDDHPARPPAYQSHDRFWSKRGYRCQPNLQCEYPWLDLGQQQETLKPMRFWLREW